MPDDLHNRSWFKDGDAVRIYVYLLCKAVYCDWKYEDITLHTGEFVGTKKDIAKALNINSVKTVINLLDKIEKTGDISMRGVRHKYTVFTITALQNKKTEKAANTDEIKVSRRL